MPAKYVRPYAKGQKNDFNDADAIAEAVQRPTMKFVAVKTVEQLDLQALHRVREKLVSQRTAVINQIRAFMLERGVAVRQGALAPCARSLATCSRRALMCCRRAWCARSRIWPMTGATSIGASKNYLGRDPGPLGQDEPGCERLMTVPGIGPIISSAIVAGVGSGDGFSKGRDFAAWLGLVTKQISTGDRTILGKTSKRGNRYLRVLFVQAAHVVLVKKNSWERYGLKGWIEAARERLHYNVLAIALANKLARIAWAVLAKGRNFEVTPKDTTMFLSPNPPEPGAVPGLVKAETSGAEGSAPRP